MKKIFLGLLFIMSAFASFGQVGSQALSGVFYRVTDTLTYQSQAATRHAQDYHDIYWNEQATTPHWDVWNGSSYDHIFGFGSGGGDNPISFINNWVPATGSGSYAATIDDFLTYDNSIIYLKFENTNAAAGSVNVNFIGSVAIRKWDGSDWVVLAGGEIDPNTIYKLSYSGAYYQMEAFSVSGSSTTRNKLPPVYHVNDFTLVPGDTSVMIIMEDNVSTVTLGDFSTGVDGSQFVLHNSQDAVVTIDPDGQQYLGSLTISDSTFSYIYFANDTFRISSSGSGGGGGAAVWGAITGTLSAQTDLQTALDAKADEAITIATTSPLSGGGDLSTNRTLTIANAAADGSTKGAASFTANDFDASSGNISIDYTNGQAASGSTKGFLASADWTTFNNKLSTGLARLLTGTNTFTGAVTDVGSSSNTYTSQFDGLGVTNTEGAGALYRNATAAAANAQQISPVITQAGNGWKTNATAASQDVRFQHYVLPIQSAASPIGSWLIRSNINSGGYNTVLQVRDAGQENVIETGNTNSTKLIMGVGLGGNTATGTAFITSGTSYGTSNAQINLSTTTLQFTRVATMPLWGTTQNSATQLIGAITSGTTSDHGSLRFSVAASNNGVNMNPASGNLTGWEFWYRNDSNGSFSPSSGGATWKTVQLSGNINQTSTANGTTWDLNIAPTFTSVLGAHIGIDYNPSITSITGAHYGIRIQPAAALNGFGLTTPVSTVDIDGSLGLDITSTSTDITANATHHTILVDASGAARTITLPAASGATRRIYRIKKTDASANSVTIDGNASENIDGVTTKATTTQYAGWVIQCDGSNWHIIGTISPAP